MANQRPTTASLRAALVQAFPTCVEFIDIEPMTCYLVSLTVQNTSRQNVRFRLTVPTSKYFRLLLDNQDLGVVANPTRTISPGLSLKFDVAFLAESADDVPSDLHDKIHVLAENSAPIVAKRPAPQLDFESLVDLGMVVLSNRTAKYVNVRNTGAKECSFRIEMESGLPCTITPKEGVIPARSETKLKVDFNAREMGTFRAIVTIHVGHEKQYLLDISAVVVEHNIELVFPASDGMPLDPVKTLSFGALYHGETRKLETILRNNGPHPVGYQTGISFSGRPFRAGDDMSSPDDDGEYDDKKKELTVTPSEGLIPPYASALLTFVFKPNGLNNPSKLTTSLRSRPSPPGSRQQGQPESGTLLKAFASIECSEINQNLAIEISGTAVAPQVVATPDSFDFGECASGARVDMLLNIKNQATLPLTYSLDKLAHFAAHPAKGRLDVLQSQNIVISFVPAQLGRFQTTFHLDVQHGSVVIPIHVKGAATSVGTKKELVGGVDALPSDFHPKFNFVTADDIKTQSKMPKPTFHRVAPYEIAARDGTAAVDEYEFQGTNNTHLTYCVNELADRANHRDGYNHILSQYRHDRLAKQEKSNQAPSNPIDMDMIPKGGLKEPHFKMPVADEPLWMQSSLGNRRGTGGSTFPFDDNKIIKKKFKPQPVTQAEVKDCATTLTSEQLKQIVAGPKTINFGKVCAHSVSKKSFSVTNDLPHNILVTVHLANDHDELQQTTPLSQVIPTGATAGFDFTFFSRVEQVFQKYVNYSINGQHSSKLLVTAEVVPIRVELSTSVLEFSFDASDLSPHVAQEIVMKNPGNSEARFSWMPEQSQADCAFEVTPPQGTIAPGGSCPIRVSFCPRFSVPNQTAMVVSVDGGKPAQLHCIGHLAEPKCVVKEKRMDFGTIAAGIAKEKKLLISNQNTTSATVFYAEIEPPTGGLTVRPSMGALMPGETAELIVSLDIRRALLLEGVSLEIKIRGGRMIRVPLAADIVVPNVCFNTQPSVFDFGGVTLGVLVTREVSITNPSPVAAQLLLDFGTCASEFNVAMPPTLNPELQDDIHSIFIPAESEPPSSWQLCIPPSTTLSFRFLYRPNKITVHSFPFPIQLVGIPFRIEAVQRTVQATGLKPRMLFSSSTLDFEKRVITRDAVRKIPYSMGLTLTNDDPQTVKWSIDLTKLKSKKSAFHIAPSSGELASGDKCTVRASFLPTDATDYAAEVPVLLDDAPYVTLALLGKGIHPHLSFSVPRVDLPTVPLGITTTASFFIHSTGYDNLELSYRLPIDLSRVPITVTFPEGKSIGIANPKVQIDLSFCCTKSIAFNAKLEFFDAEGSQFDLPLSGATDNCVLTNFGFLEAHRNEFGFFTDTDQRYPVYFLEKSHIKTLTKKPLPPPPVAKPEDEKKKAKKKAVTPKDKQAAAPAVKPEDTSGYVEVTGKLHHMPHVHEPKPEELMPLMKWLNMNILKTPMTAFPNDLVNSAGRPVYEMLEIVCGKTVPGRIKQLATNKREQSTQLMGQYVELLRFLKSYGALLNDVRPEQLLDQEQYIRWSEDEDKEQIHRRLYFEKEWHRIACLSWTKVIFQIIKCFVLFRISMKSYLALPGIVDPATKIPDVAMTRDCTKSNVYSESEMVLIQWLLHHSRRMATVTEPRIIMDLEQDLKDGVVLCYVLMSHVPTLAIEGGPLNGFNRKPTTSEHCLENATCLRNALSCLGMDYGIPAEHLCNLSLSSTVLLLLHLYQNVPQFIPKTTIEFKGVLGQTIQKSIELKNPSKKTIVYDVFLEGQVKEFSIYSQTLTLEPEKSQSFLVDFKPKFTRTVQARLTFRSLRDGPSCAATMVFLLESNIYSRKPIRVFQYETAMYDRRVEEIVIENQFPVNAIYKLTVLQQASCDTTTKKAKENDDACIDAQLSFFLPDMLGDTLPIRKEGNATVKVEFLPLNPGVYKCQLLFLDENVGEFMYELHCTAHLPPTLETLELSSDNKPHMLKELIVPVKNPLLNKALAVVVDRFQGLVKAKVREGLRKCEECHHTTFHAEVNSPYFVLQNPEVVLKTGTSITPNHDLDKKNATQAKLITPRGTLASPSTLMLDFQPRGAGLYTCKVLLRSTATCGCDIRVYEIHAKVTDVGIKTMLEFSAPARQTIVQDIPIINPTDEPWSLRATLTGTSGVFTGATSLSVAPGKTSNYSLVFKPQWLVAETGTLMLQNLKTGQDFEFGLSGIGEEPLAVQHVVLNCHARQSIAHEFEVQTYKYDPAGPSTFTVESDLPYVGGPSQLVLPGPSATAMYKLSFNPLIGGAFFGSITFTNTRTKEYSWYTIDATVLPPDPEATLEMTTTVRSAVGMEISLENPLDHAVVFDIILKGNGLFGPTQFALGAQQTGVYQLLYSPLIPGNTTGSIGFTNEDVGEFSYLLNLHATPAPPIQLEDMLCAVGDVVSQPITITNPMDTPIPLEVVLSNTRNFRIRDENIVVKPLSTYTAILDYIPSSLSEFECAEIQFLNPDVGTWEYKVQGKGKPPSVMKTTLVHAVVGEAASSLFTFRNPFPDALSVEVTMVQLTQHEDGKISPEKPPGTSGSHAGNSPTSMSRQRLRPPTARPPVFDILLKKPKVLLEGFGILQVPISFMPNFVSEAGAQIIIKGDKELEWVYPIRGIAEAPPNPRSHSFVCRARESCEKKLSLELLALEKVTLDERFTVEWDIPEPHARVIERTLSVTPLVDSISSVLTPLEYLVRFDPLKPIRLTVALVVKKRSGGLWRFDIHLDASEPVVDDVLTIESALNQTSSVSFKLTNQFRESTPFQAEFTPGSSQAFTVYPVEGMLAPYGTEGTSFTIAFTPTGYGKMCSGQLVVLTDEMQWTFNVKGTHPEYKVPQGEAKVYVPTKGKKLSPPSSTKKKKIFGRK
ncbi:Aste57867_20364 [Aphanomyces stellatus]|uniref:Aste57867_20364 protein n=1 Tax=Aphanomyces stellatus TaxID=120398 RepID=A0A485LET0_9STRA|nr:hypothetical protein As57867_020298 [Aphanomyces stellatus]VFT97051.1 Aste57867_20364 [Aphanomyces stellatus]